MGLSSEKSQTTIAVSRKNHRLLSKLGRKGQSFDDVLTEMLTNITDTQTIREGNRS
jgi:flagellar hook-basal body complex protein FliE